MKDKITLAELYLRLARAFHETKNEEEEAAERDKIGWLWKMENPHKDEDFSRLKYIVLEINSCLELCPLFALLEYEDGAKQVVKCDEDFRERFCIGVEHAGLYTADWELEPYPELEKELKKLLLESKDEKSA